MRWHLAASLVVLCLPWARADEPVKYPLPAQVRTAFLKLLDRPRVPLDVRVTEMKAFGDGTVLEQLSFAAEKKADDSIERVPTLILRPPHKVEGRLPAVIVLHGTGGSKEGMLPFLKELVKRGLVGVAIDARYHGGRAGGGRGANAYNEAIIRAWRTKPGEPMEHPFYYDTCWDLWRLADYLATRPDVDMKRLGMIGFSMGGIEAWLAASADERIKVTVPAIAVQSFRWSLEHDRWQGRARTIGRAHEAAARDLGEPAVGRRVCRELWGKVLPGILDQFDCPSMLRLFAGRPLLILSGTKDGNCPYPGARLAIAAAERAYREAGAADRLRVLTADVGHTVTAEQRRAALDWFEQWLKQEKGKR
jgi:dienelactone hydrolase